MQAEERRSKILDILNKETGYLNATKMAQELSVSRQIIVSDIAILRERGADIISTPRGYFLNTRSEWGYVDAVPCKHDQEGIRDEFYTIVDNGGVVIDVSIEHPLYGLISAALNIRSRYDADLFIERLNECESKPLSALTDGFHIHRLGVQREDDFLRICAQLRELGILCEDE